MAHSIHTSELRSVQAPAAFDLGLARRLVLRCESEAASAKSWAAILSGRLQSQSQSRMQQETLPAV
jgi:hypothetical protein